MVRSNVITDSLRHAANDSDYVSGFTHNFYRYPARFSPRFAAAAIESFSQPGDLVLDPFMGGGTTVVEAMVSGRRVVGSDINALAGFVTRVKTTPLNRADVDDLTEWCDALPRMISYGEERSSIRSFLDQRGTVNLSLPRARAIKKGIAIALRESHYLRSQRSRHFARCVVLRTAQWALDSRRQTTTLDEFRRKLVTNTGEMIGNIRTFARATRRHHISGDRRVLLEGDAREIHKTQIFADKGRQADLVLTSPPYPGIHVVYNRWQVDGRKETPAPYWIAACRDGKGLSYYTFGDRQEEGLKTYFEAALKAFTAVRSTLRQGGYLVQLVAFSKPETHLRRYLAMMSAAGFTEVRAGDFRHRRVWRKVPNRRWHAAVRGDTSSAREVVLVHTTG